MADETFVDITYRDIDLGRRLRLEPAEPGTAHLSFNAPMPVGSRLSISTDHGHAIPVRVVEVQEQVADAPKPPGMLVVGVGLEGEALSWWREITKGDGEANDARAESKSGDSGPGEDNDSDEAPASSEAKAEGGDEEKAPEPGNAGDEDAGKAPAKADEEADSETEAKADGSGQSDDKS